MSHRNGIQSQIYLNLVRLSFLFADWKNQLHFILSECQTGTSNLTPEGNFPADRYHRKSVVKLWIEIQIEKSVWFLFKLQSQSLTCRLKANVPPGRHEIHQRQFRLFCILLSQIHQLEIMWHPNPPVSSYLMFMYTMFLLHTKLYQKSLVPLTPCLMKKSQTWSCQPAWWVLCVCCMNKSIWLLFQLLQRPDPECTPHYSEDVTTSSLWDNTLCFRKPAVTRIVKGN